MHTTIGSKGVWLENTGDVRNENNSQAWRYITDATGKRTHFIIPVSLTDEQLEDAFDAVLLARREHEPTLSLEEVKQMLRQEGKLP
jgi:hypothetical protein